VYSSSIDPSKFGNLSMLAIRLPEDIEARLDNLAKRTGRTKTFYARQAILDQLGDLEDLYLAEQRWLALQQGESRAASLADVEAELGLGG
jgi:RHH-type transcriptional regulator, rel operon repressor / antitoxin RelB